MICASPGFPTSGGSGVGSGCTATGGMPSRPATTVPSPSKPATTYTALFVTVLAASFPVACVKPAFTSALAPGPAMAFFLSTPLSTSTFTWAGSWRTVVVVVGTVLVEERGAVVVVVFAGLVVSTIALGFSVWLSTTSPTITEAASMTIPRSEPGIRETVRQRQVAKNLS